MLKRILLIAALACDLALLPNCFPPVPDTNPKTLDPGQKETGITYDGSWFLLFPQSLSLEHRQGVLAGLELNARLEGFHTWYSRRESYPGDSVVYISRQDGLFTGLSLGLKQRLHASNLAAATHLGFYRGDLGKSMLLSRSYLLLGPPHLHVALGIHAHHVYAWDWTPSFSIASTLGARHHFKWNVHFESVTSGGDIGGSPTIMPSLSLGYALTY